MQCVAFVTHFVRFLCTENNGKKNRENAKLWQKTKRAEKKRRERDRKRGAKDGKSNRRQKYKNWKKQQEQRRWRRKKREENRLFFRYGWLQVQLVCAALNKCHLCVYRRQREGNESNIKYIYFLFLPSFFCLFRTQATTAQTAATNVLVPGLKTKQINKILSHDTHILLNNCPLVWHYAYCVVPSCYFYDLRMVTCVCNAFTTKLFFAFHQPKLS